MNTEILTDPVANKSGMQAARTPHAHENESRQRACLIVNADDWGLDSTTTDRAFDCFGHNAISSVSAMMFMEDSERAARIALRDGVDTGLHLNFTLAYSVKSCPAKLIEHQQRIARALSRHRLASVVYYPWLTKSFEYVVRMQIEEFEKLYGTVPARIDGHHHMHLCANVLRQQLLPDGIVVRRNLSFSPGEKSRLNRMYRSWQDSRLAHGHRLTDFFFDLYPVESLVRLKRICELATRFSVEVETHPIREEEYSFLMSGGLEQFSAGTRVARGYVLHTAYQNCSAGGAA